MAQTKIAGLFLDPTVVSGLTAITDGAPAVDYLFVWDAGTSTLKKILPNHLGLAAAAHTIESHTATSATGTNLETLTNAGDADALHTHAAKASLAGPTFTGTTTFATLSDGTIAVTAWVDQDDMSSNSATLIPTQQSVKAYVDAAATTYTDALIDGTVNNLLVLRNVHNEISTISSTTVIDGGPWEFYDGDSATLSKATTLLGGYIITLPATANQRGHFRFPTGFGSYGSSNSVTSAQDWTISCRVILAGNDRFDFFMGMMLHTDTTDYTYNAARRSHKHRIGIATDFILDNFHLFVDDDGSETVEETSTSPNGGAVHRITLKIRNGGQLVQGFLDGVQIGNDITANIPTITAGMLVCGTMSDAAGTMAVQTCEIQDLVAFREA